MLSDPVFPSQSFGHRDGAIGGIQDFLDPRKTRYGNNDGVVYEDGWLPTKDIIDRIKKVVNETNIDVISIVFLIEKLFE